MSHINKGSVKTFFSRVFLFLIGLTILSGYTKASERTFFKIDITAQENLLQQLPRADSGNDTTLSIKRSKEGLNAPVVYHADDSMVLDVPGKKIMLYGRTSKVNFQDNELSSPFIEYDQKSSLVRAFGKKDTSGYLLDLPTFVQGGMRSMSDTIMFSMKTLKGLTKGTYTQEGEMYIYGARIKKVSDNVFFGSRGRFTTCNLDTPHFAFVSNKIKFISGKMAVTGPVHPEVEGVPLPVVLPFGIYPLTTGRHSGLMAPTFSANQQLGLALEGLGYYKVLSDNWDIILQGTLYSYGGWSLNANPRYYKRYRYQGSFAFNMQEFKTGFKGDPDFQSSRTFNIRWSHSMDNKARPGVTFNANVNAGSTRFNEQVPNNPTLNFNNQLSSSITWAKVWKDKPYNISVSANHNQNNAQRLINVNLPDVNFNLNTLYPFRRKEAVGSLKWYENLGIALNSNVRSLTSFYDTSAQIQNQIADNWQWGASHNVPITLSLPPLGFVQVSPSVSYSQRWYQKRFDKTWNATVQKIDTAVSRGFYAAHDVSFGLSASSRIFGMFTFGRKSRLQAIRHEIRPSISVNYKPDLVSKYFYDAVVDATGNTRRFSRYEGSVFGSYGEGKFGGLSFNLDNNLQMKLRSRGDTSAESFKKVSLIDGFGITGSYNFLVDSFRMSNLNLNLRTNILDKINITGSAIFDPYLTDNANRRIDKLVWSERPFSLGFLTGGSVSMGTSFRGGSGKKKSAQSQGAPPLGGMSQDEYQSEMNYISNNPAEYVDFAIPWDLDLSYSLRFSRFRSGQTTTTQLSQDVNLNGSMNLTPQWKVGFSGFYNITQKQLGTMSLFLSREMHCWQMAVTISPVGLFKYFSINISPKSGLLRDLRINRTRYFYNF